jgi:hypothetical protein
MACVVVDPSCGGMLVAEAREGSCGISTRTVDILKSFEKSGTSEYPGHDPVVFYSNGYSLPVVFLFTQTRYFRPQLSAERTT